MGGGSMDKRTMERYCGDLSQLFGIDECVLAGGRDKGTRAYLINNGRGLNLMALRDKCLAIPRLSFHGINMGFVGKCGISAPEFFQEDGTRGFLRNFEAGFLTTCGLQYMGTPTESNGHQNGLHGVISNTPLENTTARVIWNDGVPEIEVTGDAREAYLFGPNLVMHKRLVISTTANHIELHDTVENKDWEPATLMLLYHFNYGYPFLCADSEIYSNYDRITARDAGSEGRVDHMDRFSEPIEGFEEIVAFRTMTDPSNTKGVSLVYNPTLGYAVKMSIDASQLPILNEWKSPRAGDYVLGMEPGTGNVGGLDNTREKGQLLYIQPGESKHYDIAIDFLDDPEVIAEEIRQIG